MFIVCGVLLFSSSVRSGIWRISLLTELGKWRPSQTINISPRWGWNFQTAFHIGARPSASLIVFWIIRRRQAAWLAFAFQFQAESLVLGFHPFDLNRLAVSFFTPLLAFR